MRKLALIVALTLGAACRGGDGIEPLVTTSVQVSSSPNVIAVNATAQASAIVKDQNGNPLTGKAISWTSLNQGIATVSANGTIRGVAPGNATIQGSVDGVTGSTTVTIVAPAQSCASGPVPVDIATGQVSVMSSLETKGCIKVSSTAAGSGYVLIAGNTNALPDVVSTYAIKSDEGETIPAGNLLASPYRVGAQLAVSTVSLPGAVQAQFESRLRSFERRELDLGVAQRAHASKSLDSQRRMSLGAVIPNPGDKGQFKVPGNNNSCNNYASVTATARYISSRAIIYTDDASPPGGFTDADFQAIAKEFDELIYPTDVDYFGNVGDLDKNSRVIILYTPEVNKLTPANQQGFVGGFFFVGDLFPSTGQQSCQQSNMAEIFYALAPDPAGTINNNVRTTVTVRQGTRGTIAHELVHMINASVRIASPIEQEFEATWLDEGLAHFGEDVNGRVLKGLTETGNYKFADLISSVNDFNAFFYQNFARFSFYLREPGPNSPTSSTADESLAARGAAWALLRYTADHYAAGGNVKTFTRGLIAGPDTGVKNLMQHAGNIPFDTLIAGWMVANYADDAGIPGLPVKYTYKTYDMRDNVRMVASNNPAGQVYQLRVIPVAGSISIPDLTARSASGNYFTFSRAAGAPARTFRFLNDDQTTAASFTGATFILLRTQ